MECESSGSDDKSSGKNDESEDEVRETGNVDYSLRVQNTREGLTMYGRITRSGPEYPTPSRIRT